ADRASTRSRAPGSPAPTRAAPAIAIASSRQSSGPTTATAASRTLNGRIVSAAKQPTCWPSPSTIRKAAAATIRTHDGRGAAGGSGGGSGAAVAHGSDVEPDIEHVPVRDHVVAALDAQP